MEDRDPYCGWEERAQNCVDVTSGNQNLSKINDTVELLLFSGAYNKKLVHCMYIWTLPYCVIFVFYISSNVITI